MSEDVTATLAAIRERQAVAASAPDATSAHGGHYRALAQLACQDTPHLLAAVEAVLKLHQPVKKLTRLGPPPFTLCADDEQVWPCSTYETIRALAGKDSGDGG